MYEYLVRPEQLFGHIFGDPEGFLVTFTGQQARFSQPDAPKNQLRHIEQRFWMYPEEVPEAEAYLLRQARDERRDTYVGIHLYRDPGNRRSSNAVPTVRCLWLDEDEGDYPPTGPSPTAIIHSSQNRRHLYWRLAHPVSVEWPVALNRRIAVWAGGDTGKAGASTVLRAPGTKNFKRHPDVDDVVAELTEPAAEIQRHLGPLPECVDHRQHLVVDEATSAVEIVQLGVGELTAQDAWDPEVVDQAVPELPEPEPAPGSETPRRRGDEAPFAGPVVELGPFLDAVEIIAEVPDVLGTKYAIRCPWLGEHSGGDWIGTFVGLRDGGGAWFFCHHSHCQGRGWREFRERVRSSSVSRTRARRGEGRRRKVSIHIHVHEPGEASPGRVIRFD